MTTWQADVEARTIGAQVHDPVVYDGRWPGVDRLWDVPRISSYPYTGSAIDILGQRADPSGPGRSGQRDRHRRAAGRERRRTRPARIPTAIRGVAPDEMQMVSDFLRPDAQSLITDTCGALPCFAGSFTGP